MTRTTDDPAEKRSVSFPRSLLHAASARWKAMGYRTLSAYLQHLMRQDVTSRGDHIIAEQPPGYAFKRKQTAAPAAPTEGKQKKKKNPGTRKPPLPPVGRRLPPPFDHLPHPS